MRRCEDDAKWMNGSDRRKEEEKFRISEGEMSEPVLISMVF